MLHLICICSSQASSLTQSAHHLGVSVERDTELEGLVARITGMQHEAQVAQPRKGFIDDGWGETARERIIGARSTRHAAAIYGDHRDAQLHSRGHGRCDVLSGLGLLPASALGSFTHHPLHKQGYNSSWRTTHGVYDSRKKWLQQARLLERHNRCLHTNFPPGQKLKSLSYFQQEDARQIHLTAYVSVLSSQPNAEFAIFRMCRHDATLYVTEHEAKAHPPLWHDRSFTGIPYWVPWLSCLLCSFMFLCLRACSSFSCLPL